MKSTQHHPLLSVRYEIYHYKIIIQIHMGFPTFHANRDPSHIIPPISLDLAWKVEMELYNNRLRFALKAGGNNGMDLVSHGNLYETIRHSNKLEIYCVYGCQKITFYSLQTFFIDNFLINNDG